jgi:hypothetical protein
MLVAAADHWGQRKLFEKYYAGRNIHGADVTYYGGEELVKDWGSGKDFEVRSMIPRTMKVGDPMTITWELRNANEGVQEKGALRGTVSTIDEDGHRFTIAVPPEERAKIAPIVEAHRGARDGRRRFVAVNADRLLAWQLFWRGENFYSGGEIWNPRIPDMRTAFKDTDNVAFLAYLRARLGEGKKYWLITEIGRLDNLRQILPTETAKRTMETPDRTSNKFGLATFTLDEKARAAPMGEE